MKQFYLTIGSVKAGIIAALLIGISVSVFAMEQEKVSAGTPDLLAALGALAPEGLIPNDPIKRSNLHASTDDEYATDAKRFILLIPSFLDDYPELPESEITKMLAFFAEKNPTTYNLMRDHLVDLKERDLEVDQSLKKELALKLFRLEYQFRYVKAKEHEEERDKVMGEKEELDKANTKQITKTKYANGRSIVAVILGALVTLGSNLLNYYLNQPTATPCTMLNGTII